MFISEVGGLIAASKKDIHPAQKLGRISIIERIVLAMQQAGVFPIVVVTGENAEEVRYCLAHYGVIFLHNEHYAVTTKIDSVKLGLQFLQHKCQKIVFASVIVPMFAPKTILKLLAARAEIVTPSYEKRGGHPIVLAESLVPEILAYTGADGLRGFIAENVQRRQWVEVNDAGVRQKLEQLKDVSRCVEEHNQQLLQPVVNLCLDKEKTILDRRGKLLLYLIEELNSVRKAAEHMALSYSKAWEVINTLESEAGFAVVTRRHGGSRGGRTTLTDSGANLLQAFLKLEREIMAFSQLRFQELLVDTGVLTRKAQPVLEA